MADVRETLLPGVGVRHEFTTEGGVPVAVVTHRGGRREIAVYDRDDPDASSAVLTLTTGDTRTLTEVLGASHVTEAVAAVQQQIEGLSIEWLTVTSGSPSANATIADGAFRTRTGASLVALVRADATIPAPTPDTVLLPGDVAVAVGTPDGLAQLRSLLSP